MNILGPIYRLYEWLLWRKVSKGKIPQHVGVILDGNRRFAREHGLDIESGYRRGAERVRHFLKWCLDIGIKVITLYAFSTENFQRDEREVSILMKLLKEYAEKALNEPYIYKYKVRIRVLGRKYLFPEELKELINELEERTKNHDKYFLNIALGYGGRAEIVDAVKKIVREAINGKIDPEEIDEDMIRRYLYTDGLPDPDIIIRTSGEERLSGFLLWQSAYSELYFLDVYWPAIRKIDFLRAIRTYQQRERRFGR
ncbi:MAG: polyprenyl diphosphate synthase [Candidatus Baldrarchaeia archaeon]